MFRKALLTTAAAVVMLALSSVARADTITVVGNTTGSAATATVTCSFNDATNTFEFTITNTSPSGSTITGIGFDLIDGDFSGNNSLGLQGFSSASAGAFTFRGEAANSSLGNVPQFNDAVLDFGFTTGNSSNFNGGTVANGIAPGGSLTFTVTGPGFGNNLFTEEELCQAIFVRFQNVPGREGSDVGHGGPPHEQPIPEPMTMILFGTGLAGVAARARRRFSKKE